MDAHLNPAILIDARIASNPKILDLPSDSARWAWIATLGAAKLERPAGAFTSRRQLAHLLGPYAEHIDALLEAGLLEETEDGRLVVHDWVAHQQRRRHAEAQAAYRQRSKAAVDGEVTPPSEDHGALTPRSPGDHATITSQSRDDHVEITETRAGARPLQSQSQSQSQSPGRETGERGECEGGADQEGGADPGSADPVLEALFAVFGRVPSRRAVAWADELGARYGPDAVASAIRRHADEPARALSLARADLERDAVLSEREAERRRAAAARAAAEARDRRRRDEYAAMLGPPRGGPPTPLAELLPDVVAKLKGGTA